MNDKKDLKRSKLQIILSMTIGIITAPVIVWLVLILSNPGDIVDIKHYRDEGFLVKFINHRVKLIKIKTLHHSEYFIDATEGRHDYAMIKGMVKSYVCVNYSMFTYKNRSTKLKLNNIRHGECKND